MLVSRVVMPRIAPLRTLDLARAPGRGGHRHLAAASGLVACGGRYYVVADDEHHLGVFDVGGRRPGDLLRVRGGLLPSSKKQRKRLKPDFESIVVLPPFAACPFGALFVLGSGSKPNRREAVLMSVDARGDVRGGTRRVDLSPWYAALGRRFRVVNIEGAFVDGPFLALLQRGNKAEASDARIRVALAPTLDALARRRRPSASDIISIDPFVLGRIDGVPLCFTDGAALPGGAFAFTAVAEDTDDGVADGPCTGAALGIIGADDRLRALWRFPEGLKPEGVCVVAAGPPLELLVCTDADDADRPARFVRVTLDDADLRRAYAR
jgi:hypothetical protein